MPEVPAGPGWTVTDLVRHLGGVHRFLAHVLRGRLTVPPDPAGLDLPAVPDAPGGPADWFARGAHELVEISHELGTDTPVWIWSAEQTSGFWLRMQWIEPAVHRWDAESAMGTPLRSRPPWTPSPSPSTSWPRPAAPGSRRRRVRGKVPLPVYGRSAVLDRPPLG
ncbi:maleylpyruvate isomerase family mycothiol-dependent enzyme [Streptomyces sp. NPDC058874]|uniref:maleylpyruvate isomerase family mycothiol-dependent enzyme n=1 Tax=unclassified Streptomyces TaxID=2593676 RepID=UPI003687F528